MMKWTTETPKTVGFYWGWYDVEEDSDGSLPGGIVEIVEVKERHIDWAGGNKDKELYVSTEDDGEYLVSDIGVSHWMGPLEKPNPPMRTL